VFFFFFFRQKEVWFVNGMIKRRGRGGPPLFLQVQNVQFLKFFNGVAIASFDCIRNE